MENSLAKVRSDCAQARPLQGETHAQTSSAACCLSRSTLLDSTDGAYRSAKGVSWRCSACESGVAARVRCNNKHLCHQRAGCGPATSRIAFHDKHCCAQMQANLHTQYERASVVRASQPNSLSGRRFAQRSIQAAYPACESGEPRQHCCVHSTALRCRRTSCAVSPARLSPPWKQAAALKKLHGSLQTCRRSMHSTQLELVF